MNKTYLGILLFFISAQSFALSPPLLRCISVANNGNVSLNWTVPVDIVGFNSYHIYRSSSLSGVYVKVDSVFDVNQTSYVDAGVNANNQSYYYYIKCRFVAGLYTVSSDTLQSIRLTVVNTGTGLANLAWNAIHTPALSTTSTYYQIYKSDASMISWTSVDSTQNIQYVDTITVCHDTVFYRIEIKDASNCYSASSVDGKLFEDQIAPISYGVDTVSVNYTNGKVVIGWHPSPSLDTWGYVIRHDPSASGVFILLDTVYGRLNTMYVDSLFDPCLATKKYKIAAFDSCYNTSLYYNDHTTILLNSQLDVCANKISLNWTPYINMNPTIAGYKIFMSKDGGAYNAISINDTSTLNYTYNNTEDSTTYCFYVQAFENTGQKTSSSCEKCHVINKPSNPEYLYIRTATVVSDNQIDVKIHTDPTVLVDGYQIFKSKSVGGPFTNVETLHFTNTENFTFTDYSVNALSSLYYYKVTNTDSCGNIGITSNTAHTILLTGSSTDGYNKLDWTDYGDWAGNVDSYSVYRAINGGFNASKIADVSSLTYQYLDDIQNFTESDGKFIYYIKANESPNVTYNFVEESNSNKVEITQTPEMYIPNAFVPDGINKEFKPVMAFVNSENYLMQIYNRFGQLIFESKNPDVGWDGKYKGEVVSSGVYVYLIRYSKPYCDIVQKKGIVTVVY